MLKFVAIDAGRLGQKRKQCQKACVSCRKKKRRCGHLEGPPACTASSSSHETTFGACNSLQVESAHSPTMRQSTEKGDTDSCEVQSTDDGQCDSTLVGNSTATCNTMYTDIRKKPCDNGVSGAETVLGSRFIGDLNPEGMFLAATSPAVISNADQSDRIGVWLTEKLSKRPQEGLRSFPDRVNLSSFYGFDPLIQGALIPLLAEESLSLLPLQPALEKLCSIYFDKHHPIFPVINKNAFHEMDPAEPACVLLKQGMCLVASMNTSAKPYLLLPNGLSALSPREFGRRISAAMRTSIDLSLVTGRVVIIQALALLSFFIEGPSGGELSSQICGRAVHYVHSVGLHINTQNKGQDDRYAETLLCCIWALDRLNAALHGRPVLMHERDIGRDMEACFGRQKPYFQLFLQVIMLLDKVIDLYRPGNNRVAEWMGKFPLFEDLLANSGGSHIPTSLLATIEIMYYAVAILSCRSKSVEEPGISSMSYLRQNYSAAQIISIIDHESRDSLSWFPFVPYAISLSLSVAYREMRYSKIPMYRARARTALLRNCEILEDIGDLSWSASIMAEMGKATLAEMERVYSEVATSRQQMNGPSSSSSVVGVECGGCMVNLVTSLTHGNVLRTADAREAPSINNNGDEQPQLDHSLPAKLGDLDVFALFDPNFDLEGIDACLGGNLDLSIPTTLI